MKHIIFTLAILLYGCAHIDTDAIKVCADSFNVACAGSERLIAYDKMIIDDGIIYKHVNGAKFSDLVIKMDDNFCTIEDNIVSEHAIVKALNCDMQEFNRLLLKMSSDDPIDKSYAYFATSIEAHNRVLSRSFLYFANEYVMSHNLEMYQEAMISNHSNIVKYSELMMDQMYIVRSDMWVKYIDICDTLGTSWGQLDKTVATRYVINMNARMKASDTLVLQLIEFYQELPLVYAELVDAKRTPIMWWKRNNYDHIFRLQQMARNIRFTLGNK